MNKPTIKNLKNFGYKINIKDSNLIQEGTAHDHRMPIFSNFRQR